MFKKILPCVVGLGYVGLPVFLRLQSSFLTTGYDINKKRIITLKKTIDVNKEFRHEKLQVKNKSYFTSNKNELKKSNFYIVSVPTPVNKNNLPDLSNIISASKTIAKYLKKGDIIVFESTVYPGTTKLMIDKYISKYSTLKEGTDFHVGYSPERVNPGDLKHSIEKISKILAVKSKNLEVKKRFLKVYKKISKKIVLTNSIENAETAKVIENIQRDLNIALMNDIFIFSKKMNYNFKEIIKLASSKWNFLKFNAGLVGGHCLPVDPYYLSYIAKKNNISLDTVLAGRSVNKKMKDFILNIIKKKIVNLKKNFKKCRVLFVGITYKNDVADIRNSNSLEIYLKIKSKFKNITAYDYVCDYISRRKFQVLNKLNKNLNFNLIVFLVNHKKNRKIYNLAQKKKIPILDPFNFYG